MAAAETPSLPIELQAIRKLHPGFSNLEGSCGSARSSSAAANTGSDGCGVQSVSRRARSALRIGVQHPHAAGREGPLRGGPSRSRRARAHSDPERCGDRRNAAGFIGAIGTSPASPADGRDRGAAGRAAGIAAPTGRPRARVDGPGSSGRPHGDRRNADDHPSRHCGPVRGSSTVRACASARSSTCAGSPRCRSVVYHLARAARARPGLARPPERLATCPASTSPSSSDGLSRGGRLRFADDARVASPGGGSEPDRSARLERAPPSTRAVLLLARHLMQNGALDWRCRRVIPVRALFASGRSPDHAAAACWAGRCNYEVFCLFHMSRSASSLAARERLAVLGAALTDPGACSVPCCSRSRWLRRFVYVDVPAVDFLAGGRDLRFTVGRGSADTRRGWWLPCIAAALLAPAADRGRWWWATRRGALDGDSGASASSTRPCSCERQRSPARVAGAATASNAFYSARSQPADHAVRRRPVLAVAVRRLRTAVGRRLRRLRDPRRARRRPRVLPLCGAVARARHQALPAALEGPGTRPRREAFGAQGSPTHPRPRQRSRGLAPTGRSRRARRRSPIPRR